MMLSSCLTNIKCSDWDSVLCRELLSGKYRPQPAVVALLNIKDYFRLFLSGMSSSPCLLVPGGLRTYALLFPGQGNR